MYQLCALCIFLYKVRAKHSFVWYSFGIELIKHSDSFWSLTNELRYFLASKTVTVKIASFLYRAGIAF
jgi:hypothetical protein